MKIDANAATTRQVNEAEVCVAELEGCVSDDEDVTPQRPAIRLIKTAGTAANGAVFSTTAGPVTYTYVVTNTGPLPLVNVTVKDDAGTPAVSGDDFFATCPKTTLAVGRVDDLHVHPSRSPSTRSTSRSPVASRPGATPSRTTMTRRS